MEFPRRVNEAKMLPCCRECENRECFHYCECYRECGEYDVAEKKIIAMMKG